MKINENYLKLGGNYLFSEIAKRVEAYKKENPQANIIKMGIGDVTLPLPKACVNAMKEACDEMGRAETFRGYGPENGYAFLREKISESYLEHGVTISPEEIFVSDGAKCDLSNILDIFGQDNVALVPDPVYPVYVDTNVMDGREVICIDANYENDFLPIPDENIHADLIYICSPNNPTGAVYTKEKLAMWVDYATRHDSIILFDAAYERFISDDGLPCSIYEIEGAKNVAIEFCSFSKTAGFTGTRCGYAVLPDTLVRGGVKLSDMWHRRQSTKYNGTSYIIQKGACAVYSEEGKAEIKANLDYYRRNAMVIANTMEELGIEYFGGKHSPYVFMRCPNGVSSWDFFTTLLTKANIVATPGSGFGKNGEGYIRFTAFSTYENTVEAMARLKKILS